jgi:hypothetical protein
MQSREAKSGVSSKDVRDLMLELMSEYQVLVDIVVVPSMTPKLGQIYVRAVARVMNDQGEPAEERMRGGYFPSADHRTLTGLFYGLLWGLERDLDIRRQMAESGEWRP